MDQDWTVGLPSDLGLKVSRGLGFRVISSEEPCTLEKVIECFLPLLAKVGRNDNRDSASETSREELRKDEARFDGLADANVIRDP